MRRFPAVALVLLVSGCSSGLKRPVQEVTAVVGPDQVQHVKVVAHTYWFEPNRIVVHAGKPVELEIKNHAVFVPHNMTCMGAESQISVKQDLGMFRGRKVVRFTPTQPGEYPFYCDKDSHASKGMKGVLVVVP
jgi:plastocyanin